ncbi:MAG: hypothetical protein SVP26_01685, partial [Chloroflexota bacterium]|nr:hypothetical protein [Chloroflexota bacterium]
MTRVRGKYPRAWRLATVTVVLFLVAAVSALFVVPTMVSGAGDPWADAVWHSYRVKDPTFAVGAPDSSYARLEYNGYLDLDLGDGEEVYDGPGDDLTVHGKGTSVYAVYAWDGDLWQSLGTGSAVSSFDLGAGGLASTQYVRILPWPSRIYLDAVEAGYVEPWNSPPQPSFTSPDEGEQLSEGCVLVEAEDLSGEGDIVRCDFWYYYDVNCNGFDDDGSTWTEVQQCVAQSTVRSLGVRNGVGNCSVVWDVSALPDCCYIIGVQMEDDQAQVGNATRSVELSKNNPEPEIVEPAWDEFTDCGNTTLGGVVTLSAVDGNTTDQGMDIDLGEGSSSVRFMYCYAGLDCDCDSGWSEIPGTVVQHEDAGRYWTLEWDTTQFSDCCHRVLVEMTDKHGLTGNSSEYCVGLGTHVPELVFVEPDECDDVSGNVTLRVEDVGFDVGEDISDDCVSFYYCDSTSNECPYGTDCAGTWVWIDDDCEPDGNMTWSVEWDTSGAEDCYHVVKANVTDNHGLEGNGTMCIGVANDPPQPQITSPTTGEAYGGNVTISVIDGLGAGDIAGAKFFYWYDGNCTSYENCTDPGPESEEWV